MYSPAVITGILAFLKSFLFRVIITSEWLSIVIAYRKPSSKSSKFDVSAKSIDLSSSAKTVAWTYVYGELKFKL